MGGQTEQKAESLTSIVLKNLKPHHWLMIVGLLLGYPTASGFINKSMFTTDTVSQQQYQFDRTLDSTNKYYWQKDIRKEIDTTNSRLRRIEELLNSKKGK